MAVERLKCSNKKCSEEYTMRVDEAFTLPLSIQVGRGSILIVLSFISK